MSNAPYEPASTDAETDGPLGYKNSTSVAPTAAPKHNQTVKDRLL